MSGTDRPVNAASSFAAKLESASASAANAMNTALRRWRCRPRTIAMTNSGFAYHASTARVAPSQPRSRTSKPSSVMPGTLMAGSSSAASQASTAAASKRRCAVMRVARRPSARRRQRRYARALEVELVADGIAIVIDEELRRVAARVVVGNAHDAAALERSRDEIEEILDGPIRVEVARVGADVRGRARVPMPHVCDAAVAHGDERLGRLVAI